MFLGVSTFESPLVHTNFNRYVKGELNLSFRWQFSDRWRWRNLTWTLTRTLLKFVTSCTFGFPLVLMYSEKLGNSPDLQIIVRKEILTRMHSSRMRAVRNSSRLLGGVCCWGVPASGGCLVRGVTCSGGCLVPGGACSGRVSQHTLRQTPPVNRITDRCKNITFATLLRTVTRQHFSRMRTARLPTVCVSVATYPPPRVPTLGT